MTSHLNWKVPWLPPATPILYMCSGQFWKTGNTQGVKEAYMAWRSYMMKFGFGRTLDTDLANEWERVSYLPPNLPEIYQFKSSRWRALPIMSLSIGQGDWASTPLQLANNAALIANRGPCYILHIIREIEGREIPEKFRIPVESGLTGAILNR